ncbi:MAG: hypothetical protein ACPGJV_00370 [Bacteriovoracaceae bacterium]
MHKPVSNLFFVIIFSLFLALNVRNITLKESPSSIRSVASRSIKENCLSLVYQALNGIKGNSSKMTRVLASGFNFKKIGRRIFAKKTDIDIQKVEEYYLEYIKKIPRTEDLEYLIRHGKDFLPEMEKNAESYIAYLYAFNRGHHGDLQWLEPKQLESLRKGIRKRVKKQINGILTSGEVSKDKLKKLVESISWDLMGKESKKMIRDLADRSGYTDVDLNNNFLRRTFWDYPIREMFGKRKPILAESGMRIGFVQANQLAMSRSPYIKVLSNDSSSLKKVLTSCAVQYLFFAANLYQLSNLDVFVPFVPFCEKFKLTKKGLLRNLGDDFTQKEYFEAMEKDLRSRYGNTYGFSTLFVSKHKAKVLSQRINRFGPAVAALLFWWKFDEMKKEREQQISEQIGIADFMQEELYKIQEPLREAFAYGMISYRAYDDKKSELTGEKVKKAKARQKIEEEQAEIRVAMSQTECRELMVCVESMGMDEEMSETNESYLMCKEAFDPSDICSFEQFQQTVKNLY